MKILHVSNFGDKHNGRLFWNQCFKISNGFIRNGHSVLNFSDRDKSRAYISNRFYNNKKLQNDLIETIDNGTKHIPDTTQLQLPKLSLPNINKTTKSSFPNLGKSNTNIKLPKLNKV